MVSSFSYGSLRLVFFDLAAQIVNCGMNFVVFADCDKMKIAEIFRTSANRYVVSFASLSGISSCVYGTFKECILPVREFFGEISSARF